MSARSLFPIQMLQGGGEVERAYQESIRKVRGQSQMQITQPQKFPEDRRGEILSSGLAQVGKTIAAGFKKREEEQKKQQQYQQPAESNVQTMRRGGKVTMRPRGTDTVPVMATPGEFVLNRGAVETAGRPFLHYLNEMGKAHPIMMQDYQESEMMEEGGEIDPRRRMFPVRYMLEGGPTLSDGFGVTPGDIWGPDWTGGLPPDWPPPGGMPSPNTPSMNIPFSPPPGLPDIPNMGTPSFVPRYGGPGGFPLGGGAPGGPFEPPEFRGRTFRPPARIGRGRRGIFHPRMAHPAMHPRFRERG